MSDPVVLNDPADVQRLYERLRVSARKISRRMGLSSTNTSIADTALAHELLRDISEAFKAATGSSKEELDARGLSLARFLDSRNFTFETTEDFLAWATTAMKYIAQTHRRRKWRRGEMSPLETEVQIQDLQPSEHVESAVHVLNLLEELKESPILAKMVRDPGRLVKIAELRLVHGMEAWQIAEVFGVTESAINYQLREFRDLAHLAFVRGRRALLNESTDLKDEQRDLLAMLVQGKTIEDICTISGSSPAAVRKSIKDLGRALSPHKDGQERG